MSTCCDFSKWISCWKDYYTTHVTAKIVYYCMSHFDEGMIQKIFFLKKFNSEVPYVTVQRFKMKKNWEVFLDFILVNKQLERPSSRILQLFYERFFIFNYYKWLEYFILIFNNSYIFENKLHSIIFKRDTNDFLTTVVIRRKE